MTTDWHSPDRRARLITGDSRLILPTLPDQSVNCCVTSPPYFGLRDYGCDGQMGLEPSPAVYVAELKEMFREVRRVLKDDGTLWLNLGDSYSGGGKGGNPGDSPHIKQRTNNGSLSVRGVKRVGEKPKDLIGIPWRVAFALQADGWVLRQEIIWSKPNPMPESVTDRCTKAHEQIFLFAKAQWKGPDNGRFASISDEDARWLALCIDTEGCIVVKRCKHEGRSDTFAPQVSFGSTSRTLMERFVSIVGYGNLVERAGKNQPMVYWQVANNIARDFLHRVYPYLIIKQRQARIGIYVDDLTYFRGGKRDERKRRTEPEHAQLVSLWERNKSLNHFGDPDISDVPEPVRGRWGAGARYYFDAEAIAEQGVVPGGTRRTIGKAKDGGLTRAAAAGREPSGNEAAGFTIVDGTRNKRSVWTVTTKPYSEAHFATFPPDLIRPCILAGCPEGGVVLDPFAGSGTTLAESKRLGRRSIGIELSQDYVEIAKRRIDAPELATPLLDALEPIETQAEMFA